MMGDIPQGGRDRDILVSVLDFPFHDPTNCYLLILIAVL